VVRLFRVPAICLFPDVCRRPLPHPFNLKQPRFGRALRPACLFSLSSLGLLDALFTSLTATDRQPGSGQPSTHLSPPALGVLSFLTYIFSYHRWEGIQHGRAGWLPIFFFPSPFRFRWLDSGPDEAVVRRFFQSNFSSLFTTPFAVLFFPLAFTSVVIFFETENGSYAVFSIRWCPPPLNLSRRTPPLLPHFGRSQTNFSPPSDHEVSTEKFSPLIEGPIYHKFRFPPSPSLFPPPVCFSLSIFCFLLLFCAFENFFPWCCL